MKNIKDITISIFGVIGFISILSSYEKPIEPQQTFSTPESHVWSFHLANDGTRAYSINAITGELREVNKANYTVLSLAKRQQKRN